MFKAWSVPHIEIFGTDRNTEDAFIDKQVGIKHFFRGPKVYGVPETIDTMIARLKLNGMGIQIDELTEEQKKYLNSWNQGT